MGIRGGAGEGGTCGSGKTTCSPVHSDSNPALSADLATANIVSGSAHGPVLIPNNPNFMSAPLVKQGDQHRLEKVKWSDLRIFMQPHINKHEP